VDCPAVAESTELSEDEWGVIDWVLPSFDVITMREYRERERLEGLYGRDLSWPEVFRLSRKTV
jgi:hypothetical protein